MPSAREPRSAARGIVATSVRKLSLTSATCPPSAASAKPCSPASSTMPPARSASSLSMVAVVETRTISRQRRSAPKPAFMPDTHKEPQEDARAAGMQWMCKGGGVAALMKLPLPQDICPPTSQATAEDDLVKHCQELKMPVWKRKGTKLRPRSLVVNFEFHGHIEAKCGRSLEL